MRLCSADSSTQFQGMEPDAGFQDSRVAELLRRTCTIMQITCVHWQQLYCRLSTVSMKAMPPSPHAVHAMRPGKTWASPDLNAPVLEGGLVDRGRGLLFIG